MLKGSNIFLRKLSPSDAEVILKWENNAANWEISGTTTPFTEAEIDVFVNGEHDIVKNKQIRYIICLNEIELVIGTIDLFEFDSLNKTIGIGVLIAEDVHRKKGYAGEALALLLDYCSNELSVVNAFCNITKDNEASIRLFEKNGFQFIEERKLYNNRVNYYEKAF